MKRTRAPSRSTQLVLEHLWNGPQYGYGLIKATGLKSGTLYPILMRLTERGFLEAKWEDPPNDGRPARQTYELTSDGRDYAKSNLPTPTVQPIGKGAAI